MRRFSPTLKLLLCHVPDKISSKFFLNFFKLPFQENNVFLDIFIPALKLLLCHVSDDRRRYNFRSIVCSQSLVASRCRNSRTCSRRPRARILETATCGFRWWDGPRVAVLLVSSEQLAVSNSSIWLCVPVLCTTVWATLRALRRAFKSARSQCPHNR